MQSDRRDSDAQISQLPEPISSKKELLLLLDSVREGILVHADDGSVVWANERAEELLGLPLDALLGRTPHDPAWRVLRRDKTAFAPAERPTFAALHTGESQRDVVLGVQRPDGSLRWFVVNATPIESGAISTLSDVTSVVEGEDAAQRTDAQLAAVMSSVGHAVVFLSLETMHIAFFNLAAERMFGYAAEEIIGKQRFAVLHEQNELRQRGVELGLVFGADGSVVDMDVDKVHHGEWTMVRKDGTRFSAALTVTPVRVGARVIGKVGIIEDISRRKQQELHFKALLHALPDTLFRVSAQGVFLDAHVPDSRLLVAKPEHFIGRTITEILPRPLALRLTEAVESALATGHVRHVEYDLATSAGQRDFEARVVRSGESEVVVIVRDVTEAKVLDRMKSEFVSNVSHELRTPITSIRGALSLLDAGVVEASSREGRELLSAALRNAERLGRLINDILDLDREHHVAQLNVVASRLWPLVERALFELEHYGSHFGVRYVVRDFDFNAVCDVDPDRFQQVLYNLLSNAAKHGARDSEVVVRSAEGPTGFLRVCVENQGYPIPETFRPFMFQRFAMVDASDRKKRQGSGLGLAITRSLVERMGGCIDYESSTAGTVFFVDVPLRATTLPSASHA